MGAEIEGIESLFETIDDIDDEWGHSKEVVYLVGTSKEYGPVIEFGSDPHVITPDDGGVLKFTVDGTTVYTDKVNHPGTQAYPFLRPSLDAAEKNLEEIAKTATSVEDFVKKVALFVEKEAKKTLTENGNVDTGALRADVRSVPVKP